MVIDWDDKKAEANLKKHGISFEEAATVLSHTLTLTDWNEYPTERRLTSIGYSSNLKVLYVVSVEVEEGKLRIVSARKATKHEKEKFEEGI